MGHQRCVCSVKPMKARETGPGTTTAYTTGSKSAGVPGSSAPEAAGWLKRFSMGINLTGRTYCPQPHRTLPQIPPPPAGRSRTSRRFRLDAPASRRFRRNALSHPAVGSGKLTRGVPAGSAGALPEKGQDLRERCPKGGRTCGSVARKGAGSAGALPEKGQDLREGLGISGERCGGWVLKSEGPDGVVGALL